MQKCGTCRKPAPIESFLPGKKTCQRCRERAREYNRQRYLNNREEMKNRVNQYRRDNWDLVSAQRRAQYRANPSRVIDRVNRWQLAHPERARLSALATKKVRQAISEGVLIRPKFCEQCGRTGCRIDAAHEDYSLPLQVKWLCRSCHVTWDQHEPKTR